MNEPDLLLVNPCDKKKIYGKLGSEFAGIEPPLWTGLIASFIREKRFSVKVIDADAENLDPQSTADRIISEEPLLTGISVMGANPSASSTPKMPAVRDILAVLKKKKPRLKTMLYGIHPSALPEKTLREESADFISRGESFYTILELLKSLKSKAPKRDIYDIEGLWYRKGNKIIGNGWGRLVKNLDELSFVAWDLLPMDKYRAHNWHCFGDLGHRKPYAVTYTSLGCPFDCAYCNIRALYDGKPGIRFRSIPKVIEEIGFLVSKYKVRNIKIIDELFVLDEKRVTQFCDMIIERGYDINFWVYARVDTVNKEMLRKMKAAGINWICYGIESASKKVRSGVTKGRFDREAIKKAIDMTHDAGIYVIGNFMFGLPDDDLKTMQETLDIAKELNCEYVNFYTTMAYPGSRLFEDAAKAGIPMPDDWLGYSQFSEKTSPLPTNYLSNEEVLSFRDRAFYEYFSDPSYIAMIIKKFGKESADHIRRMCEIKIKRDLLNGKIKDLQKERIHDHK